jgi:hypothetical protein
MEVLSVFLVLCGLPLAIFLAGWTACYLLVVKYRFRMERRWEDDPGVQASTRAASWQP